jgi:hypothetical protein
MAGLIIVHFAIELYHHSDKNCSPNRFDCPRGLPVR